MPQRTAQLTSLMSFQRQATRAVATLATEIRQREKELAVLKAQAARWQRLLQVPAPGRRPAGSSPQGRPSQRLRVDWSAVLQALPNRFTTKELAQKPSKPVAHVYVHLSRWMKEKKIRRVKDGYQKV